MSQKTGLIKTKHSLNKQYFLAFLVTIGFAITDEIHQIFVPTRNGQVKDVFIDAIGIFLMYIVIKTYFHEKVV